MRRGNRILLTLGGALATLLGGIAGVHFSWSSFRWRSLVLLPLLLPGSVVARR